MTIPWGPENAALTKIQGAAVLDRYGKPGDTPGPTLWTGQASGHLKRVHRTAVEAGAERAVRVDVFVIRDTEGAPVLAHAGPDWEASVVTIQDRRTGTPVTRTFRVTAMEHSATGSLADHVRLELDEEGV